MSAHSPYKFPHRLMAGLLLGGFSVSVWAAEAAESEAAFWWNLLIAAIVLLFSLASAALPLAALKQWRRHWRLAAAMSLLGLALWIVLIITGRNLDPASHRLWPLEIFAWAMINMIYMVALMTAKRIFEKADQAEQGSEEPDPSV
jgi:hypothetical protein